MSLKGDKYETVDEVKMRLEGTVVLYEGKPVFIQEVTNPVGEEKEIARVYFYNLPMKAGARRERRYLSSKNFDLTPFKMGYMNFNDRVVRMSRNPVRQNRQGLCYATTTMTDVNGVRIDPLWNDIMASQGFVDMVAGKYPGVEELKNLSVRRPAVALGRDFAAVLDDDLDMSFLVYNGSRCGFIDDGKIRLAKKNLFLRESLEEAKIPLFK